jgi:hypothetical protein
VSPVKYELGSYIPEDDILHSHRRDILKSITRKNTSGKNGNERMSACPIARYCTKARMYVRYCVNREAIETTFAVTLLGIWMVQYGASFSFRRRLLPDDE